MIDCQNCVHEKICKETPWAKEIDKIVSEINQNSIGSFIAESKCPKYSILHFYEKRSTRG